MSTDADRIDGAPSLEVFGAAFDRATVGMLIVRGRRIVRANDRIAELVGTPALDLVGRDPLEFVHPEDSDASRGTLRAIGSGRTPPPQDRRILCSDGGVLDMRLCYSVLEEPIEDGRPPLVLVHFVDRTAEVRAAREREAAVELFETSFRMAPIGKCLVGLDGTFVRVNAALCRLLRRDETDLLSCTFQEITHPDDLDADVALLRQTLDGQRNGYELDKRYVTPDGEEIGARLAVRLIRDDAGRPAHFVCQIIDLSALQAVQRQLAAANGRLAAILEHSPMAIWLHDLEERWVVANPQAARMAGRRVRDLEGEPLAETLPPELYDDLSAYDHAALIKGGPVVYEHEVGRVGAEPDQYLSVTFPVRDDVGQIVGVGGMSMDVSERKRMEHALARERRALAEAQQIAAIGSWSWDTARDEATWSPEMYRIFGRRPADGPATSEAFFACVHPDDRERLSEGYRRAFGGGEGFELDYRIVAEDGVHRTVHALGREDPERAGHYVGTVQDVTDLRRAEREAQAERDHSQAILSAMGEGYVFTVDGTIRAVNEAFCRLTGFAESELIGSVAPHAFWPPESHEAFMRLREEAVAADGGTVEIILMRKDGERFEAEATIQVARDADGVPIGNVNTVRDVSVQRRQQRELEHLARTDFLTGLFNRHVFDDTLTREIALARRHHRPLALVLIDVDEFKALNDTFGHPVGDAVLVAVAGQLRETVRAGETLARIGGEEFAWVLPATDAGGALRAGERARAAIEALRLEAVGTVTVSVGVSVLGPGEDQRGLYRGADEALYAAKQQGRNRCVARPEPEPEPAG